MMYNNKLVAVVKVDGKILRENGESVYIPFGSEYEIHFKNLHSTKAVVSIDIDGDDVLDGHQLVVRPNSTTSIEGFMRGSDVSHKFKFIEKTKEISEYRGDKISDGLIRISFQFEEQKTIFNSGWYSGYREYHDNSMPVYGSSVDTDHMMSQPRSISVYSCSSSNQLSAPEAEVEAEVSNDLGITVKGGESDQSFVNTTTRRLLSEVHVIVFQLKGDTNTGKKIEQPILVKTKVRCETCGRRSLSKNKFCANCGTSLVI